MKWSEARENHPDKWLLFEAVEVYSLEGQRIIEDLSVIGVFDEGRDALNEYSIKHKKDKKREMYVYHTKNEDLTIEERSWIGA